MRQIAYVTLQKKYGGQWVALSKNRERVFAAKKSLLDLNRYLEKKKIDTSNVIFSKIEKYGTVSVYFVKAN